MPVHEWPTRRAKDFKPLGASGRRSRVAYRRDPLHFAGQNIELMCHPPYSPDLASNDFFLFLYAKNLFHSQRFSTSEEVVDAVKMHVLLISQFFQ